jgi:hypothetical protein
MVGVEGFCQLLLKAQPGKSFLKISSIRQDFLRNVLRAFVEISSGIERIINEHYFDIEEKLSYRQLVRTKQGELSYLAVLK